MVRPAHIKSDLRSLDSLAGTLPFALDDAEAVGRLFREWGGSRKGRKRYLVDLWTYCYVRRYFLIRFASTGGGHSSGDLELAVERAYRQVEQGRAGIKDPARYASWVVVVCRNSFLNQVTRSSPRIALSRVAEPSIEEEDGEDRFQSLHDDAIRAAALEAAIGSLPFSLREVARLRLIQGLAYGVIAENTGRTTPVVRSYMHKALKKLRSDKRLLRALGKEEERTPPSNHRKPRS